MPERWYLWSNGRANSRFGDGILTLQPPKGLPFDSYIYDPLHPAPTIGGRHLLYPDTLSGFQDQGELEERYDVLVYTSGLLSEPLTIRGPISVELFVRTSAPGTDFCATLVDVDAAGKAVSVADGVARLEQGEPGVLRSLAISLWDTAYRFSAAHRVRLDITSSSFPRFDRNRNVGLDAGRTEWQHAVQQVMHDEHHPSALVLPRAAPG